MLKSAQGTRAASFSAKIRSLQEYHNRILNGISPLPSSVDVINVLKFFSQALLTILRDIPCLPIDLIRDPARDSVRINFFPNLDYRTLYHALAAILDSLPYIQSSLGSSAHAVYEYTLHATVCLVPFLEHELMDSMASTVANTIVLNFVSQQDIIDMLCYNILPFTLYHDPRSPDHPGRFANESIPSILMVVLSHTDSLALHSQLLECLMRLKKDIIQDLLMVIAYGTGKARHAAVELLFQYWPGLNPSLLDRRALSEKHVPWKPLTCQNETCQNTLNNEAVKICFAQMDANANAAANTGTTNTTNNPNQQSDCKGRPPIPLLICIECAEMVRSHSSMLKNKCQQDVLLNVLHPMSEICYTCESKNCSFAAGGGRHSPPVAVVTCFSPECTSFNSNKPIRLCAQCHHSCHLVAPANLNEQSTSTKQDKVHPVHNRHLVQEHLQSLWHLPPDAQQHFSQAVISLLGEASVLEKYSKDNQRTHGIPGMSSGFGGGGPFNASSGGMGPGSGFGPGSGLGASGLGSGNLEGGGQGGPNTGTTPVSEAVDSSVEERQLLSRYGIWLLIGLCEPTEATTTERMELLGRMLAMLCQWFHNTACLPDDQAGSALERIKSESIHGWLMKVIASQFQLFANCLIPNPPDYAQLGGHWESWPSITIQIKEGFKRLLCLVPYDMITPDIWAYIMPFWMESFRYDLPEVELAELRILLSKVLDPDLSPLGLPPKQMYHFISVCFENMMPIDQEQALSWLQILTLLEIPVPINLLNSMFMSGIKSFINLREIKEGRKLFETDLTNIGDEGLLSTQASTSKLSPCRDKLQLNCPTEAVVQQLTSSASIETIIESQLACFVLMLDILLKQFELQEITAHKGFATKDSSNTIKLLYEMISVAHCTESVGNVHTCTDYSSSAMNTDIGSQFPKPQLPPNGKLQRNKPNTFLNECFFCELSSIWYQLSLQLITYFAPLVEMTTMPDIDHIDTESDVCMTPISVRTPTIGNDFNELNQTATSSGSDERALSGSMLDEPLEEHRSNEIPRVTSATVIISMDDYSDSGIGQITSHEFGPAPESDIDEEDGETLMSTAELNISEQLTLKFLQELEKQSDPDVIYHLLQCLKLLTLHAGILSKMAQEEKKRKFFKWCQKRYLISLYWGLLQAEFSQISQITVPLLLHCVALPDGLAVFIRTINEDFHSANWCTRFAAVERFSSFSQFVEQSTVKNSHSLQSALSSLIIHVVQVMDDSTSAVAQRSLLVLESMRLASLRLYVQCLELQFDLVIIDRCLLLSTILQLFNHLGERRVLTWDFFLNRFDALFIEAQIFLQRFSDNSIEIPDPIRDLRNTNVHSETFKKKVGRAYEALAQTHIRRSLLSNHGRSDKANESRHHLSFALFRYYNSNSSNSGSQHGSLTRKASHQHKEFRDKLKNVSSASSTASSALNRKSSKLAALTGSAFPSNFFQESGQSKRDILQEELNLFNVVHRTLDEECSDQETMHLLIFLFMQFLAKPDTQHPTDEKALNRTQMIVLKHLNILMGHSSSENHFFLSACDLRRKSAFSAFLSALPDVLDQNLSVGSLLLPTVFPLMLYSPANHRFIFNSELDTLMPNHSLWLLQSHLRMSWLSSLIVVLYKHDYSMDQIKYRFVHLLIQIVMNTLESGLDHRCSPTEALLRRSKELKDSFNLEDCEIGDSKTDSMLEEVINDQPEKTTLTHSFGGEMEDEIMQIGLDGVDSISIVADINLVETKLQNNDGQISKQDETNVQSTSALNVETKPINVQRPLDSNDDTKPPMESTSIDGEGNNRSVEPEGEEISETSSNTSISVSNVVPISGDCQICASHTVPPPIERLLPIGGELSECVRTMSSTSTSSRPLPSVISSTSPFTQRVSSPMIAHGQPITDQQCCCCCASTSTTSDSCCINYQKTIESFKQQHSAAVREHSRERLLPIGPKPKPNQPPTSQSAHTSSRHSHSVERNKNVEENRYFKTKPSGKLLIRQHTTIGSNGTTIRVGIASELTHKSRFDDDVGGDQVHNKLYSTTISSKSVDSVPDKLNYTQKSNVNGTSTMITTEILSNDIIKGKHNQRKSTTTTNSDESLYRNETKEHQQQMSVSRISVTNGLDGETESEQETSRSSNKGAISPLNSNGEPNDISATLNGLKDRPKKKGKKKSKKRNKWTKTSMSNNGSCHDVTDQIGSPINTMNGSEIRGISEANGGGGGGENPMANGDNDVFVNYNQNGNTDFISNGNNNNNSNKKGTQSQPDSAKDTTSGRSNEVSSSSQTDLTSTAYEMCVICGSPIEKFNEQELGLCLVSLATFVHRDPNLSASLLPQILRLTSRYAIRRVFPWQMESNVHLPANTASIARQFLRCTLHQLNSNGIFRQIFQSHHSDVILFRSIAISLADFTELNQVTPLKELFESLLDDKQFPILSITLHTLSNVANYFECVFVDYNTSQGSNFALSGLSPLVCSLIGASAPNVGASIVANQPWSELFSPLEAYLRKLSFALSHLAPSIHNLVPLMRVLLALLKIPGIGAHRSILDPVTKILTHIVQHSPLLLEHVRELCILCSRAFVRDRERICIARTFACELVQALRFRTHLPDENILLLVQWALEDAGGSLPYSVAAASLERMQHKALGQTGIFVELSTTNATDALRMHITELIDFVSDVHALARIKSNFQGTSVHLNEETLGGHLKAGIAQFLSLELTRIGGADHRAITKHLPWLYSLPSLQQGPKEFLECISHVRLLSWLLLGSLQHTALMKCHPNQTTCLYSQPIPLEASTHIAEHVQAILAGFAEQSKASVLHMSALFYAFLLCQLWTVYCEQLACQNPPGSDAAHQNILVLSDFWSKVTPGVLQLICHSKVLADTVSLHFLSLMETLMECNSEILARLIPLWLPLFNSYQGQLSGNTRVRLQAIVSWPCPAQTRDDAMMISTILIRWLQRIQTKMSQIEMQSSTATQFYCI